MNREKPYYDEKQKVWKVEIDGFIETGNLLYVACEFVRSGLYYPFFINGNQDHEHSFEGVIQAVLDFSEGFSIEGFEDWYSDQEIKLLEKLSAKCSVE